jgi:hypothetical protein
MLPKVLWILVMIDLFITHDSIGIHMGRGIDDEKGIGQ